ncbi:hypothetical protein, partial [Klebsiella michiganensis]
FKHTINNIGLYPLSVNGGRQRKNGIYIYAFHLFIIKNCYVNSVAGGGMFSEDAHYEFLKRYYRAEFFEGRNGSIWGINYSYNLARVGMNMLERYGYGIILKHESITGETIYYDRSLTILFGDRIR